MQQPTPQPSQPSPSRPPQTLAKIALPRNGRGVAIGQTGSGKSTLAEALIQQWLAEQPNPRVLILDSKPRFRAERELTGLPAHRRYRSWERGPTMPNSYRLPLAHPSDELAQVWRLGGTTAIAQVEDGAADDRPYLHALLGTLQAFYKGSSRKYSQLVYLDEGADFFGSSAGFAQGNSILRAVRSGREKGLAVLLSSQRPRNIPVAVITETSNLYCFELSFDKDWEHLREMGLPKYLGADESGKPKPFRPPPEEHAFAFYNKATRYAGYHRLKV